MEYWERWFLLGGMELWEIKVFILGKDWLKMLYRAKNKSKKEEFILSQKVCNKIRKKNKKESKVVLEVRPGDTLRPTV